LFSLLVDERVRLDDNRKEQVMKALFKKIRQHVEKTKGEVCIPSKQNMKKSCVLTRRLCLGAYSKIKFS
jgi:hypothetical protein